MTNLVITVIVKDQYGNQVIYPGCAKAEAFASIAGTRTLTQQAIKHIKELGYTINVKQKEVRL